MADRFSVRVSEKAQGLTRGLRGSTMGNWTSLSRRGRRRRGTMAARWVAGPVSADAIEANETVVGAGKTRICPYGVEKRAVVPGAASSGASVG
jgi:hypothetical protein